MNIPNVDPMKGSYFITITLPPTMYKLPAKIQYEFMLNHIRKTFRRYGHFQLLPELTEEGNVHFHGWVDMTAIQRYKLIDHLKRMKHYGYSKINKDPIVDTNRVKEYMLKSYHITHQIIRWSYPLIIQSDHYKTPITNIITTKTPQFPINQINPLDIECEKCTECC